MKGFQRSSKLNRRNMKVGININKSKDNRELTKKNQKMSKQSHKLIPKQLACLSKKYSLINRTLQ